MVVAEKIEELLAGDQLRLEAHAVRIKNRTAQVNTRALVEGLVAAEAQITFMLVDVEERSDEHHPIHLGIGREKARMLIRIAGDAMH